MTRWLQVPWRCRPWCFGEVIRSAYTGAAAANRRRQDRRITSTFSRACDERHAARAVMRSHEFWKGSLRILGFGVPSMPNPSSGALKSILPGPRERSSILNAHLGGQQPPTGWGGSKTTGPRGARGRQGDDSRACECGSDFRVDSAMAPIWGPYDKTRGCRQTT